MEAVQEMTRPAIGHSGIASGAWTPVEFEAVFLEHFPRVLGVLTRLTSDRGRAEDLANEVFMKLYKQPPPDAAQTGAGAWLYRTACNLGIDELRASARRRQYESRAMEGEDRADAGPLDDLLREEQRERVRRVLGDMKPAQAQILALRSAGCSYKEIAAAAQTTGGSVGTLLNRAEAEFRKRYLMLFGSEEADI